MATSYAIRKVSPHIQCLCLQKYNFFNIKFKQNQKNK